MEGRWPEAGQSGGQGYGWGETAKGFRHLWVASMGRRGTLETTPGLLAKLPPSAEGSVTRPPSHPYVRALLTSPPHPRPRGLAATPFAKGRKELAVSPSGTYQAVWCKGFVCAHAPPHTSRAHLCLRHLLLFTVMSYLVLSSDASFPTSKEPP